MGSQPLSATACTTQDKDTLPTCISGIGTQHSDITGKDNEDNVFCTLPEPVLHVDFRVREAYAPSSKV